MFAKFIESSDSVKNTDSAKQLWFLEFQPSVNHGVETQWADMLQDF